MKGRSVVRCSIHCGIVNVQNVSVKGSEEWMKGVING
jgi:hypothetical protein